MTFRLVVQILVTGRTAYYMASVGRDRTDGIKFALPNTPVGYHTQIGLNRHGGFTRKIIVFWQNIRVRNLLSLNTIHIYLIYCLLLQESLDFGGPFFDNMA